MKGKFFISVLIILTVGVCLFPLKVKEGTIERHEPLYFMALSQLKPSAQQIFQNYTLTASDRLAAGLRFFFCFLIAFIPVRAAFSILTLLEWQKSFKRSRRAKEELNTPQQKSFTVAVPFKDEQKTLLATVESILNPNPIISELILVDDGSTDQSSEILMAHFGMEETAEKNVGHLPVQGKILSTYQTFFGNCRILLIRKTGFGKHDALNCAINYTHSNYIFTVDGDTILSPDALINLAYPMIEDSTVYMTSGSLRCMSEWSKSRYSFLEKFQILEYFNAYLDRPLLNFLRSQNVITGALACYHTDLVRQLGGFSNRTLAEDRDICMHAQKFFKDQKFIGKILFIPHAFAWTQMPFHIRGLFRQRVRWTAGAIQTLIKYRSMALRPKYGWLGTYTIPAAINDTVVFPLDFLFYYVGIPLAVFFLIKTPELQGPFVEILQSYFLPIFITNQLFRFVFAFVIEPYYQKTFKNIWSFISLNVFCSLFAPIWTLLNTVFIFEGYRQAFKKSTQWKHVERRHIDRRGGAHGGSGGWEREEN